jgi:hypothetical protein
MLRTVVSLAIAALAFAVPAHAQNSVTGGNNLLAECEGADLDSCYSYLLGAYDGLMTLANVGSIPLLCPGPGGVNGAQLRLIFEKYARENPQFLSEQRGYVATSAFILAFPCKK